LLALVEVSKVRCKEGRNKRSWWIICFW